jgi:hypothetical protein
MRSPIRSAEELVLPEGESSQHQELAVIDHAPAPPLSPRKVVERQEAAALCSTPKLLHHDGDRVPVTLVVRDRHTSSALNSRSGSRTNGIATVAGGR